MTHHDPSSAVLGNKGIYRTKVQPVNIVKFDIKQENVQFSSALFGWNNSVAVRFREAGSDTRKQ